MLPVNAILSFAIIASNREKDMTKLERLNFALIHLDRTQAFHGRIEARVAVLLALNVAMASVTVTNLPSKVLHTCVAIPGIASLALMGTALFFLMLVSYSHLATKSQPSLLYFGDIARLSSDEFMRQASVATFDALTDDALCQIWRNSEIVSAKFRRTQRAFYLTCAAVTLWLVFLMLVTVQTGALPMLGKD